MKKTRRIAAMVAAMTLAATMAVPSVMMNVSAASLDEGEIGNTITINQGAESIAPTNMAAYQIFKGTYGGSADTLNVSGWGDGVEVDDFVADLKKDALVGELFSEITDPADLTTDSGAVAVAGVISGLTTTAQKEAVARIALANKKDTSGTYASGNKTIAGVPDGYYVVADISAETSTDPEASTYTLALLKVAGGESVSVTTKVGLPTFEKKIADVNDSTKDVANETAGKYDKHDAWSTDADYDIGDAVPFQLIGSLPSNFSNYDSYKMVFHDDLDTHFTLNEADKNSVAVYYSVDGTWENAVPAAPDSYGIAWAASADNDFTTEGKGNGTEDFYITFADILGKADNTTAITTGTDKLTSDSKVFITYTATLNDTANLGTAGNWNEGYLEYSNNPNFAGDGTENDTTEETPHDNVVAFTYKTEFTKIDAVTQEKLVATFELYKKYATAPANAKECEIDGYQGYYLVSEKTSDATTGQFGWTGLDDGQYVLVETVKPTATAGEYKDIAPIPFTIDGTHASKELTALNGKGNGETCTITGLVDNNATVTIAEDAASLSGTVANTKSTTLPSTGGMGTTLFVLGGGVTMAAAGIYLVSKKRAKESSAE